MSDIKILVLGFVIGLSLWNVRKSYISADKESGGTEASWIIVGCIEIAVLIWAVTQVVEIVIARHS